MFSHEVKRYALPSLAVLLLVGACSRGEAPSGALDGAAREVTLRVPAALRLERELRALTVTFDPALRASTTVELPPGTTLGIEATTYVFPLGAGRPPRGRVAVVSGDDLAGLATTWTSDRDGIPATGTRYAVELELVVFATAAPPGPGWQPRAARFQPLWSRTLRQAEE
jgi:hypothetical protein